MTHHEVQIDDTHEGPPKGHVATAAVLMEVLAERRRQDAKWGEQNHSVVEWIAVETEELGEAAMAANKAYWGRRNDREAGLSLPEIEANLQPRLAAFRGEMIQVAAVAVAAVEALDRNLKPRGVE